jgi:hypothetical protein
VRDLHQQAGAVTRVHLAPAGAAVIEIAQHLQGLLDDLVGGASLDMDDEADAAGVMLETRVIEALPGRQAVGIQAAIVHHLVFDSIRLGVGAHQPSTPRCPERVTLKRSAGEVNRALRVISVWNQARLKNGFSVGGVTDDGAGRMPRDHFS